MAVCGQMERIFKKGDTIEPTDFMTVTKTTFLEYFDNYIDNCKANLALDTTEGEVSFK